MARFTQWYGGDCPVEPSSKVEVTLRNGKHYDSIPASDWGWMHSYGGMDIMEYRIVRVNNK